MKVGAVHLVKTELFSKEHHCKIKILDVHQERLGDISADDVYAEGYSSIDEYVDAWIEINGSFDPDQLVYVVAFEVLAEATAGIDELLEEAQHGIDEVTLGTDEAVDEWPTEADIAELEEIEKFLDGGGSYATK